MTRSISLLAIEFPCSTDEAAHLFIERSKAAAQRIGASYQLISGEGQVEEILRAIEDISADVIVYADNIAVDEDPVAERKRELLEKSPVPVLLLPETMAFAIEDTRCLIVPVSGEHRRNEALRLALRLAVSFDRAVKLVHVTDPVKADDKVGLGSLGDQAHHEYAKMIDKVVSEASPTSDLEERMRVTEIRHLVGCTADNLGKLIAETPGGLLCVEWQGCFLEGHAETIKTLLKSADYPVLFVKRVRERKSKLKTGKEFEAA